MTRFLLLTLLAAISMAESFEVASITPCPPGTPAPATEHAGIAQFVQSGGRFAADCTTPRFLFEWAYELQPSQHSRGPEWFETERFKIIAKAEGEATEAQMKRMAQDLLVARFHLKFHIDQKELPVFIIATGRTEPKLAPSGPSDITSLQSSRLGGPDAQSFTFHVTATRYSIARLADVFSRQMGRPILDQTNLPGEFNFGFDLTLDASQPRAFDPSVLMTALREQLGLTFRAEDAPVDYYVIDSADKLAIGN